MPEILMKSQIDHIEASFLLIEQRFGAVMDDILASFNISIIFHP